MNYLRHATASQEILLGRFVDSTDGDTEETGLTIANTDIKIWKNGATTLVSKNSGGGTHIANGNYYAVLDATDSDTLGAMEVHVHVAGALSVKREYTVLPALVYDSLIVGGPAFPLFGIIDSGTAQSASSTGVVIAAASAFADDVLIGGTAFVYGSTQAYWQERQITDNALSGDALTVDTWTVTPSGTLSYILFGGGPGSATLPPPVNVVQGAGVAWNSGAITANTLAANAIAAAKIASDAITAIQSGLATASALATVATYVDTEVAAIKAKTDNLPSDPADASDIASSFSSVASTLSTIAAYIDTEVAAIKAQTDKLTFSTGNALQADLQRIENATTIDGVTITKVFRAVLAILFSKTSGLTAGVGTATFRDADDNSNFASVTVDSDGNRTAATIN